MGAFLKKLYVAVRCVFPTYLAQSQAIAFDMFQACFPMLLTVLGIVSSSPGLRRDILTAVRPVLRISPGAYQMVAETLTQSGGHAWSLILLGVGGTLLAGTTMMRFIIDGMQMIYDDPEPASFWSRNLRAVLLLVTTMAPWLVIATMIVLGRQARDWLSRHYGLTALLTSLAWTVYVVVILVFATLVLAVIYRVGRPRTRSWDDVLPGAVLATGLWWVVSSGFGVYVRYVPYRAVYGGLAAAIALMLWMQLTASIILIGAAYNAEREEEVAEDALAPHEVQHSHPDSPHEVTPARSGDTLRVDGARKGS